MKKKVSNLLIGISLFALFIGFPYFVFAESRGCDTTLGYQIARCTFNSFDYSGKTGSEICQAQKRTSCIFFCEERYGGIVCSSGKDVECNAVCSDDYWACCESGGAPPPPAGCESQTVYKADREGCGDVSILEGKRACKRCEEGKCLEWEGEVKNIEKVAICNPWQKPKRKIDENKWDEKNVTEWGEKEIWCRADAECFKEEIKVEKFLDGRGEVTSTEIHLPVKFEFKIKPLEDNGWGLVCGANELEIETYNFTQRLKLDRAFSNNSFSCANSDREKLDDLWEKGSLKDLADFLVHFTKDESLKLEKGEKKTKGNRIITKEEQKTLEFEYFQDSATTKYESYQKLKLGRKYKEIKKQIEYFIPFKEDIDLQEYLKCSGKTIEGENIDKAYCSHWGGRNPNIKRIEPLLSNPITYTYSPSQDREVGPCKIKEGAGNVAKIRFCAENGCGPKDAKGVPFSTVDAPEPIGILAFLKRDINLIYYVPEKGEEELKKEEPKPFIFEAKVTRWIDTDWNGDGFVEIPDAPEEGIGADFVDFQFCGQNIEPFKPSYTLRALYRGKKIIYDPSLNCPTDPELQQKVEKEVPEVCVDINEECICETNPQWCDKYCGKIGEIENLDICHPLQNPESLRIKKGEIENIDEFKKKNHLDEEPLDCPSSYPFASSFGIFLGEKEEISIDWKDDPYYGMTNLEIPYPKNLWKWDIYGSMQYFSTFPTQNVWQVQKMGSQYFSQKWHFKLTTKVPLKEKRESLGKNLWKANFVPMTKEDLEATVIFYPINVPTSTPAYSQEYSGYKVFNRLQELRFRPPPRSLSFKINVCIPGKGCLKIPTILTQLRYRKTTEILKKGVPLILENSLKKFTFWEMWPCLKYPGATKENINDYRLNKAFDIYITPCKDEWGEECIDELKVLIKAKSTGAIPKELSPPPPSPAKVPRKLKMASAPGAPSYILELISEGKKEYCAFDVTAPEKEFAECWVDVEEEKEYTWRARSCADVCNKIENENFLHCGKFSTSTTFYGCPLLPPVEPISPKIGESFLPGSVTLSFEKIPCNATNVFYQLVVTYSRFPEEKRKECEDLEKKGVVDTILSNTSFLLSDLNCFGTYYWRIRGCLSSDCSAEVGRWSRPWYFNIVPKLPPSGGGGGFGGIGTCKKIAPDCPVGGCTLKEIPKLISNILNCLLWTGTPILLIVGVISTGLTLVFFATNVELMEGIRRMWKGIGIGILIMFFGWTILNIIFLILGWRKEVFGDWFNPF